MCTYTHLLHVSSWLAKTVLCSSAALAANPVPGGGKRPGSGVLVHSPSPLGAHSEHRQGQNSRIRGSVVTDSKNSRRSEKGEATLGWRGPEKLHGCDLIRAELQRQVNSGQARGAETACGQRDMGAKAEMGKDQAVCQFVMSWGASEGSRVQARGSQRPQCLQVPQGCLPLQISESLDCGAPFKHK